jgi:hypothetical protein
MLVVVLLDEAQYGPAPAPAPKTVSQIGQYYNSEQHIKQISLYLIIPLLRYMVARDSTSYTFYHELEEVSVDISRQKCQKYQTIVDGL